MRAQVPLGRLYGIRIGLNWSVLVIAVLLTDILATGVLPRMAPGRTAAEYAVAGAVVGALFIAGILAHEMAHAVVAVRSGTTVRGITLWALGGVTEMEGHPPTPRAELAMAAAGPLTSLFLGLLAIAAGGLVAPVAPALVTAGLLWIGVMNVILAVFNLLPGAPLDGGRVLRAAIWMRTHDRIRATVLADRAGRVLGAMIMALGLMQVVFASAVISGLWFTILGWFIATASIIEEGAAEREERLAGITVAQVMQPPDAALPADLDLDAAARRMLDARQETAAVVERDGRPVGFVTVEALLNAALTGRHGNQVRDVATRLTGTQTVSPDAELGEVFGRTAGARPVAVVRDGLLVGVLNPQDFTWALRRATVDRASPTRPAARGGEAALGSRGWADQPGTGRRSDNDDDEAVDGRHLHRRAG